MIFLESILALLAGLSCCLCFWQWAAARKFPLHRKIADRSFSPAISLLKPVKGCDTTTRDSLKTWLQQDYPGPVQILFGVADENDPVAAILRDLLAQFPHVKAQLIVCPRLTGANAKVAKLVQLEALAEHDLIVICDADVRVPSDFLANFVAPLQDQSVGLVNCFYRLANPTTMAMRWEAIAINADFWSQVLQSATLKPLDFALGAAILVRRPALAAIGGFKALADCLADDYQLGHRVAKTGQRVALCPVVVECWDAPANWSQVWKHQLRWARTIRVSQPLPYFFSILSNASLWPLLWLAAALLLHPIPLIPLLAAPLFWLLRLLLARDLQRRLTPDRNLISPDWLVPVRDLLNAAIWLAAFAGDTIEWRGRRMKLRPDGTLAEI